METSTMSPKAPRFAVEEDALVSQVLEIIGGVTLEALQAVEDTEERDVWSLEEGDDSVFYSDEDIKPNASCEFGASKYKNPVLETPESITDKHHSDMEKEEEGHQEPQKPKNEPMDQSDDADPGAKPEKLVSTCGESLHLTCTSMDMQTQPEQPVAVEKENLPVEEEKVVLDIQTPNLGPFNLTNEERDTRMKGEAEVLGQMSSAELQLPAEKQLQADREPDQDKDVCGPVGFHQNPSPGYCSLPLAKKSGQQNSFNHLSSSKYSTVSYRKIRRGNTRQKIEAFEYMLMKL